MAAASNLASAQVHHSNAQIIPDVLSEADGRDLFELSQRLYAIIQNKAPYYFEDSCSASYVLFEGESMLGKALEVKVYSERAGDLLNAAKTAKELFSRFLNHVQNLDAKVRYYLPGHQGPLLWSMKLYSAKPSSSSKELHGQDWHQDGNGRSMDMFLYYYRDSCKTPTLNVGFVEGPRNFIPKKYDSLNPPNNSFVRFQNETHGHRGQTSCEDGNKLLITFWKID